MECSSCSEPIAEGAKTCPHCGHSPRRVLIINVFLYYIITLLATIGFYFTLFTVPVDQGLAILFLTIAIVTGLHSISLLAGVMFSTATEDLSGYSFLIYRG